MSQATPTGQQAISAPRGVRNSATRIVASTVGVYGGLLGIEHGIGETLQGNGALGGILINAIVPQAKDVWQGREPALTLIPNFFVTGVLAIIVSLIVLLWAAACVQRKHGGLVLILLSILQFLVGGGLAPIPMIIIAGAVSTRIHAPLTWWHAHLSVHARRLLATWWPWSLIAFFFLGSVDLAIAVFGKQPEPCKHSRSFPDGTSSVDCPCWVCARYPETDRLRSGTFDERGTGTTTRWSA